MIDIVKLLCQIRTRAVSCKQMTMVTPVQLLLFAARTVKTDGEFIQLDSWSVSFTVLIAASLHVLVRQLSLWRMAICSSNCMKHSYMLTAHISIR